MHFHRLAHKENDLEWSQMTQLFFLATSTTQVCTTISNIYVYIFSNYVDEFEVLINTFGLLEKKRKLVTTQIKRYDKGITHNGITQYYKRNQTLTCEIPKMKSMKPQR